MWETALSVPEYCARMRRPGEWGGAIEMAVFAQLTGCHVLVYETDRSQQATVVGYRRIHTFAPTPPKAADSSNGGGSAGGSSTSRLLYGTPPQQQKEVRVLYSGGMHYDAVDTDADGGRGGSLLSDAAYTMSAGHPGLGSPHSTAAHTPLAASVGLHSSARIASSRHEAEAAVLPTLVVVRARSTVEASAATCSAS